MNGKIDYDISIIRPVVNEASVRLRRQAMPKKRRRAIMKGLLTLHTLEVMAVNVYKFQITGKENDHNKWLIASMLNEMTHVQDYQVKLYEYDFSPTILRAGFWMVGFGIGFASKLLGKKAILKTGIWVESKAVEHYSKLLREVEWDDETRIIIEKNQADENGHIKRWREMLENGQ